MKKSTRGRRGDEEFAVRVGQNGMGSLELPGALSVGHREGDFFAAGRADIFFRHAAAQELAEG